MKRIYIEGSRFIARMYMQKFRCAGITLREMVSAVKKLTVEKICGEKSHHGQRFAVNLRFLRLRNLPQDSAHFRSQKPLWRSLLWHFVDNLKSNLTYKQKIWYGSSSLTVITRISPPGANLFIDFLEGEANKKIDFSTKTKTNFATSHVFRI